MTPPTAQKLLVIAVRTFAAVLAIEAVLLTALACTNAKGVDTSKREDFTKSATVATTQKSDTLRIDRTATTQSAGGETLTSRYVASAEVTPSGITATLADSSDATKAPNVVTIKRDTSDATNRLDTKADTKTANAVKDDQSTGATFSGAINSAFRMDGLTVDAPAESTFKQRWPLILALLGAGLYFTFAPLTLLGNPVRGVGLLGCSALALILSTFWLAVIIGAVILIGFWPDLKKLRAFGRVTEVLDDWKSGMSDEERRMFNASLETAAAKDAKVVDKIRVEQKHSSAPAVVAADFQDAVMPPAVTPAGQ